MAPKGNKYALGNEGGRPRTVSPEPEELDKLGREMVEWVKANDPLHLSQWWRAVKGINYKTWKTILQKPEFLPHYDSAMGLIAHKYMDGTINPSIAHRFIRIVFPEVKEEENEKLEFEAKLKAEEQQTVSAEDVARYESTMRMIKDMQDKIKN